MQVEEQIIDDVASYFDRQRDHELIRAAIKQRYALGIKTVTDQNNPTASIETYVKGNEALKVDKGIYESITVGFGPKVVGALANLFSEPGQKFSLLHETLEAEQLKDIEAILLKHRKNGYNSTITEADERSIQTGSAAILVSFSGGSTVYNSYIPSAVRFYFPEEIVETVDGETVTRAPDKVDIEDAYAVVIRMSASDVQKNNYLAIMGRSVEWPQGRRLEYVASSVETEIPMPGHDSIISEYEYQGKPANPLSVVANEHPDVFVPEYPISIITGAVKSYDTPMPVSTSLYEDCLEFDTAASHSLGASQEAASGTNVLALSETGVGKPLPRSLSGNIVTQPGQEFKHESKNAEDAHTSFKQLKDTMIETAAGYSVPDYMVSSEDHTVDASSGIALEIKARPLKKERDRRVEKNTHSVNRIFEIEKWLIYTHDKEISESEANTLIECVQIWQPGEIKLPQNKKEALEEIVMAMEKGLMDTIGAIKKYYQLASDAEAVELYDTMQERARKYKPLQVFEQQKKQVGLPRNNGGNGQ
jgi:hypothetical protein